MTKQEQIEKLMLDIPQTIVAYNANPKGQHLYGEQRLQIAEVLYDKGYRNVSEYKAERELLGSQIKVLKQRLNNKCIEVYNLNRDYTNSFERLKAQEREIERLKAENAKLQEQFAKYQLASDKEIVAQVKQAKIDVLNELKKKTHNYYPSIDSYCLSQHVVLVRDIDKLLEEV